MAGAATRKISAVLALAIVGAAVWFARPTDVAPPRVEPTSAPPVAPVRRIRLDSASPSRGESTRHVIAGRVTGLAAGATARVEARRVVATAKTGWDPLADEQFNAPTAAGPPDAGVPAREDGSFALSVAKAGKYLVSAEISDQRGTSCEVEVPEPLARVEVELAAPEGAHSIRGRVVRADGAALRCWIELSECGEPACNRPSRWVAAGEDGRFVFRGIAGVSVLIDAHVAGETIAHSGEVGMPCADEIVMTIGAGPLRSGRVVADADGSPIAGARVVVNMGGEDAGETRRTTTDAAGTFSVHAGDVTSVYAEAAGFGPNAVLGDPAVAVTVVRLKRCGDIAGRVLRSSDGSPVAGAVVRTSTIRGWERSASTTSAADGSYRLENLPPERCNVFVFGGGWASVALATWSKDNYDEEPDDPFAVDVASGVVESCDLRVEPTARLKGGVLGPTGDSLRAVKVELQAGGGGKKKGPRWCASATAWTEADGKFAFPDLPAAASCRVEATSPGLPPVSTQVECAAGETANVELRFDAPQRLEVVVVSAATGAPVPGATIHVFVVDESSCCGTSCRGVTDGEGRCVVADAPPGRIAVGVAAEGFVCIDENQPFDAAQDAADPSRWRAAVRIEPAFAVTGRVVEADGTPVVGFMIQLRSSRDGADTPIGSPENTVEDGRFRISGVPAGTYWVTQWTDDAKLTSVVAGCPEFVIRLPAGAPMSAPERSVDVVILGPGGEPVGVSVCHRQHRVSGRGWFEKGRTSIYADDVGDGCFLAVYNARDAADHAAPFGSLVFRLEEKLAGPLEIRLPKERLASGRVIGADGRGVAGARLHVRFADVEVDDDVARAATDADGAFEIHQLGEGTYRLVLELPQDQAPPPPVTIRGGQKDVVVDLAAGSSVVTVLDYDGKPVRGAVVKVRATKVAQKPRRRDAEPDDPPEFEDAPRVLVHLVAGADGTARVNGIVPGTEVALFVTGPANRDDLAPWSASPWTPHDVEVRLERKK